MSGSKNRCGWPHHHFLGGGLGVSEGLAHVLAHVDDAATSSRMSAAALLALASGMGGRFGVTLANIAPTTFCRRHASSPRECDRRTLGATHPTCRGRAWGVETLVGELMEDAVRTCARLSALGEAEEVQSIKGGLLRRCVGAISRFDKGKCCRMIRRYRWSGRQRVHALANCRVGAIIKESIASDVEGFVVGKLCFLLAQSACLVGF
jgi:hypothetical protein